MGPVWHVPWTERTPNRIRRVKCGEEKPECLRCSSTGRKCDGYDESLGPPLRRRAEELERARRDFIHDNQRSEAMRPPPADAAETESEAETRRRLLRTTAAAAGADPAAPAGGFAAFWQRFVPEALVEDEAVRHAVTALSSARHRLRSAAGRGLPGVTPHDLDAVATQQYDRAVSCLARRAWDPSPASLRSTLVCCLAFICLESLRANRAAAAAHLVNGLRILESVRDGGLGLVWGENDDVYRPHPPRPEDDGDFRDVMWAFARLEVGAVLFNGSVRPALSLRVLDRGRFDDFSRVESFETLEAAHAQVCAYVRMVLGRLWETRERYGDVAFWSDVEQERQHTAMKDGGQRVIRLYRQFIATPSAPARGSPEHLSTQADLLHFNTAELFLELMTGLETAQPGDLDPLAEPSSRSERLAREMVLLASQISTLLGQMRREHRVVSSDVDVIGPLYVAAIATTDAALQEKALVLMQEADSEEGFWAGPTVEQLVERVTNVVMERRSLADGDPSGRLFWGAGVSLYAKLAKLGSLDGVSG